MSRNILRFSNAETIQHREYRPGLNKITSVHRVFLYESVTYVGSGYGVD